MTTKELIGWRKHMGFTQDEAAKALGMTKANYNAMELNGRANRRTRLACMALAANLGAARWPWE